jgi:hypothetical protein
MSATPTAAADKTANKSPAPASTTPATGTTAPKPAAPKASAAMKIPANFESNPAFDEETKAKFRRELAA